MRFYSTLLAGAAIIVAILVLTGVIPTTDTGCMQVRFVSVCR